MYSAHHLFHPKSRLQNAPKLLAFCLAVSPHLSCAKPYKFIMCKFIMCRFLQIQHVQKPATSWHLAVIHAAYYLSGSSVCMSACVGALIGLGTQGSPGLQSSSCSASMVSIMLKLQIHVMSLWGKEFLALRSILPPTPPRRPAPSQHNRKREHEAD